MPTPNVPTVCVVDDDAAILDSLRLYFETKGLNVRCFGSGEALLGDIDGRPEPSCIVSDVRMSGMSGIELQRKLASRYVSMPIILITGHADVPLAVQAIKAGAFDFIVKPFDEQHLLATIEKAISTTDLVVSEREEIAEIAVRIRDLSERQYQVMELAVQGLSNKEMAARLGISPRTVESYRAWVMEKMNARTLPDLVRMFMQLKAMSKQKPS